MYTVRFNDVKECDAGDLFYHGVLFYEIGVSDGRLQWSVLRRYREFKQLADYLKGDMPKSAPPMAPRSQIRRRCSEAFRDRRYAMLEAWLQALVAEDPHLHRYEALREFLQPFDASDDAACERFNLTDTEAPAISAKVRAPAPLGRAQRSMSQPARQLAARIPGSHSAARYETRSRSGLLEPPRPAHGRARSPNTISKSCIDVPHPGIRARTTAKAAVVKTVTRLQTADVDYHHALSRVPRLSDFEKAALKEHSSEEETTASEHVSEEMLPTQVDAEKGGAKKVPIVASGSKSRSPPCGSATPRASRGSVTPRTSQRPRQLSARATPHTVPRRASQPAPQPRARLQSSRADSFSRGRSLRTGSAPEAVDRRRTT